ncbi:hypothetical protein OH76DRAFT_514749 [Lentinus brumalis]|uniref:Uncharacterized protein n=1 Tax=Lentinus brumalis TaxID=2498619 RepID=A0A371DBB0_9APHY|nr:hypothetical protein OH76DRAFT_514749 [Polyporus brumalis]
MWALLAAAAGGGPRDRARRASQVAIRDRRCGGCVASHTWVLFVVARKRQVSRRYFEFITARYRYGYNSRTELERDADHALVRQASSSARSSSQPSLRACPMASLLRAIARRARSCRPQLRRSAFAASWLRSETLLVRHYRSSPRPR